MKARNREINIFNMSLLDVLCGALGAFCFLMLVLFPFYSQDKGTAKAPDVPAGVDPKTLEEAKARIQQLEEVLKKFQEYAEQAGGQNKRLEAENRQLQQDLKNAQDRNDQLEMRKPLLAVGRFTVADSDFVQVYVEDDRTNDQGREGRESGSVEDAGVDIQRGLQRKCRRRRAGVFHGARHSHGGVSRVFEDHQA